MSVCGDCQGKLRNKTFEAKMSIENYTNRNIFDIFEQSINTKSSHMYFVKEMLLCLLKSSKLICSFSNLKT